MSPFFQQLNAINSKVFKGKKKKFQRPHGTSLESEQFSAVRLWRALRAKSAVSYLAQRLTLAALDKYCDTVPASQSC